MRAPKFWFNKPSTWHLGSLMLSPLGKIYAYKTARRLASPPFVIPSVPVVCVGNLNAGGTGKTPTVIALSEICNDLGLKTIVVSRGYRGHKKGPLKINPNNHLANEVGDEPLLLANFAETIVSKNRAAGVEAALEFKPDVILLDDGFQDSTIFKKLSFIVVDAEKGFGNGLCIPAGPLREPVNKAIRRADAVISIGPQNQQLNFQKNWGTSIVEPIIKGQLIPLETGQNWTGETFVAFAGIGHPEKFFSSLKSLGAKCVHCEALSDHQKYSRSIIRRLERFAAIKNAHLVTTEKDAVRLPKYFRDKIITLPVRLRFDCYNFVKQLLESIV